MPCPYFDPVVPQAHDSGPANAMLPLGGVWEGLCRTLPDEPWQPDRTTLEPLCNLGYARGNCARFPGGEGPDAVRFAISRDDGTNVSLLYVIERDHHPFAHGALAHGALAHGALASVESQAGHPTPLLARQAAAYMQSYQRRKREASRT